MPSNDSKIDGNDFPMQAGKTAAGIGGTTSAGETLDRIGSAASEFNDLNDAGAGALNNNFGAALGELDNIEANDDSPLKWITPLVLLALLVALGSWFCGKS